MPILPVFALVSNLGSLVARLLLQPLEETAYAHFSAVAAAEAAREAALPDGGVPDVLPPLVPGTADVCLTTEESVYTLAALTRAVGTFGGVLLAFGPPYAWLLLRLLYGWRWAASGAPALLGTYCLHVAAMSVNGVTEAFVHATGTHALLASLSWYTAALSLFHVGAAVAGIYLCGAHGLVLANALSMAARAATNLSFIATSTTTTISPFPPLWPKTKMMMLTCAIITGVTRFAVGRPDSTPTAHAAHVGVGVACLAALAASIHAAEPAAFGALRDSLRSRSTPRHVHDE